MLRIALYATWNKTVSLASDMAYIYYGKGKKDNIAKLYCLNLRGAEHQTLFGECEGWKRQRLLI